MMHARPFQEIVAVDPAVREINHRVVTGLNVPLIRHNIRQTKSGITGDVSLRWQDGPFLECAGEHMELPGDRVRVPLAQVIEKLGFLSLILVQFCRGGRHGNGGDRETVWRYLYTLFSQVVRVKSVSAVPPLVLQVQQDHKIRWPLDKWKGLENQLVRCLVAVMVGAVVC